MKETMEARKLFDEQVNIVKALMKEAHPRFANTPFSELRLPAFRDSLAKPVVEAIHEAERLSDIWNALYNKTRDQRSAMEAKVSLAFKTLNAYANLPPVTVRIDTSFEDLSIASYRSGSGEIILHYGFFTDEGEDSLDECSRGNALTEEYGHHVQHMVDIAELYAKHRNIAEVIRAVRETYFTIISPQIVERVRDARGDTQSNQQEQEFSAVMAESLPKTARVNYEVIVAKALYEPVEKGVSLYNQGRFYAAIQHFAEQKGIDRVLENHEFGKPLLELINVCRAIGFANLIQLDRPHHLSEDRDWQRRHSERYRQLMSQIPELKNLDLQAHDILRSCITKWLPLAQARYLTAIEQYKALAHEAYAKHLAKLVETEARRRKATAGQQTMQQQQQQQQMGSVDESNRTDVSDASEQQRIALLQAIPDLEQRIVVAAFLEKYPDRLVLVKREIQGGAPDLSYYHLSGLANLVDHFGYDSPIVQRLFELETTAYLNISVLSDFVQNDPLRAEMVKQEILRGASTKELGSLRLTSLFKLASQLGYDSPALRRILNFEAKEEFYIGLLASFIDDDRTRANIVKQELMHGGVDQIDHHRLQAVLGLSGHFGYESLVMRGLLQFEKHQGIDLVALSKAIGKNENLRTLTATIFGVIQPSSEEVRNWTALAKSIDSGSWPLEKYFRIRSEASTSYNLDQEIARLKERGAQLSDQRRALKQSRDRKARSQLSELNAQIPQNIEELMDLIEVRIEQVYHQWEYEIEEAEASRITVSEQQGTETLKAIAERMRNAGDEPRISALQREYRILEIALAAEKNQMPQSIRYVFTPSPETGHLIKTSLDTSYRVSDPTKLMDGMPVKVIGPVNSENVFTVLNTAGKLPPQMPTFIFDPNSNPDNPREQAHYDPTVSDPSVRFYRTAEIQPTKVMARRSRHEVGHAIHHQYFTQLSDTIKGAVHNAYFSWLGKKQTLKNIGVASMSSIDLDRAVAAPGFAAHGKGKIELYEYSLSEMFAEMRALYEYSKTSAGRRMSYAQLLYAVTGDDTGRKKAMSNAGSLYEVLKHQVFEPYDRGEGFRPAARRARSDRSSSTQQIKPVMMNSLDKDANAGDESTVREATSNEQSDKDFRELEAALLPIPEGHTRFYSGIPAGIDYGYNCIPLSSEENIECDQLRERLQRGEDLSPELRGRYHEFSKRYMKESDEFEMSRNLAEEQRRIAKMVRYFMSIFLIQNYRRCLAMVLKLTRIGFLYLGELLMRQRNFLTIY